MGVDLRLKPPRHGVGTIATMAGVSRSTAKNALREARRLGLVDVKERRRPGMPSLTNVVRVIAPAWTAWLRLGVGGVRKMTPRILIFLQRLARRRWISRRRADMGLWRKDLTPEERVAIGLEIERLLVPRTRRRP